MLHKDHKLIMMLHGSVEYCMRSHVVLTRDHYCTSRMDVKQRVYETLQREQNGGSSWLGHG